MSKKKENWISFVEDGVRWMICKVCQSEYVKVDENTSAITCSMCVQRKCLTSMPMDKFFKSVKPKTGRPAGWHFMNEFVDKDGNVFHKGKEQPDLKGTLPPTKVKPPKKRKKLTADQKLFKRVSDYKKRRKARKK
jgi:hypothetical protein